MSVIITSPAVVLRAVKFRESSSVVTFFTEKAGKIAGMVRGARRRGNRFGSSLQPMSHVSAVIYRKPGREIQTVSQCDLLEQYSRIPGDLDRISIGMQFVELVNLLTHGEEENVGVFQLLTGSLRSLDSEPNPGYPLLYHFEIELLRILGFRFDFEHCGGCSTPFSEAFIVDGKIRLDIRSGCPVCRDCRMPDDRLDLLPQTDYRFLRGLSRGGPGVGGPGQAAVPMESIETFFDDYFRFHIAGYRRLRSAEVFRSLAEPESGPSGDEN